jgi:hypothetical protein
LADPLPFVLIPDAGGSAWYWHRVAPLLERRGYEALPVDLPGDDDDSGLPRYTDLVVEAFLHDVPPQVVAAGLAKERLGVEADEIDGGHLVALSRPELLADRLIRYVSELLPDGRVAAETARPIVESPPRNEGVSRPSTSSWVTQTA